MTPAEAECLVSALQPALWDELAGRFGEQLVSRLWLRELLAEAPAAPRLWARYGWARAQKFVEAASQSRVVRGARQRAVAGPVSGVLAEPGAVGASLERRSVRRFAQAPMPRSVLDEVLAAARPLLLGWPHLRLYVAVQRVQGAARGVYEFEGTDLMARRAGVSSEELVAATHQPWAAGAGVVVFVVVSWAELERARGAEPDAYVSALLDCGRLGEVLVAAAVQAGAGGCTASSLDEGVAAGVCGLEAGVEEALYVVRVGMPEEV